MARWARAVGIAWVVLVVLIFAVQRPVALVGPMWRATVLLGLQCGAMAAAGWLAGRLARPDSVIATIVFAVSLCFWDLGALNVPWLVRLTIDAVRDPVYWESWVATAGAHVVLFGCLIGGGLLGRPRRRLQVIFSK